MKATVHVKLKRDVLDPQGKAIQRACAALGYDAVRDIRQDKLFEVELDAHDETAARALLDELCQKLLANPVIEDYRVVAVEA
ncbi:MAG: phosphoribosylformylglycinamidine synthase subunit PurS [Deltaproteobacteria bacterium]|nr:MAG: phosphoribosylformylglycinamidine synthase subunit PurS [Deltaproteobacteria bacterium]